MNYIPFSRPEIGDEEVAEVVDTLRGGWLTMGPKTERFEAAFAEYVCARHAVAVASCTAALQLSLAAAGIGPGDEVITSPMTFVSTANVVVHLGATPVFVDIAPGTLNIDHTRIERAITARTKAIVPVHFAGQACEMDAILDVARRHGLRVIEDAAHAVGAEYDGARVGSIGDATCFSFYATKNLTTGEGGMIATDDEELAQKARILRFHGISSDAWKRYSKEGSQHWEAVFVGYKENMTDIQASIGLHQLRKLDRMIERRAEIAEAYDQELKDVVEVPARLPNRRHAHHLYVVQADNRDKVREDLAQAGVGTGIHFRAVHLHAIYRERYGLRPGGFPEAGAASDRVLSLPLFPSLSGDDIRRVTEAVRRVILTQGRPWSNCG